MSKWMTKIGFLLLGGAILYTSGCGTENSTASKNNQNSTESGSVPPVVLPIIPAPPTVQQCLQSAATACPLFCLTVAVVCNASSYNGNPIPTISDSSCNECLATASVKAQACNAGYTDLSELVVTCP